MTISLRNIFQFKVVLVGSKPQIWRRFIIPNTATLGQLHKTLQIVMGWTDSHLHQFVINQVFYGIPDDEFGIDMDVKDEELFKIKDLINKEKEKMIYEYDFGDSWTHKIILEKVLPFDVKQSLPKCLKGKRACPPEDCGGIWGYEQLLDNLNNPNTSEYKDAIEWLGHKIDPEEFDIEEINQLLEEWYNSTTTG